MLILSISNDVYMQVVGASSNPSFVVSPGQTEDGLEV